LKTHFELDEVGVLDEYVGCKIEYNKEEGWMRFTQPVLVQSFEDEFDLSKTKESDTPAIPGSVLMETEDLKVDQDEHYTYRKGVGKLIHLTKYSRPEISNAVRELSRFGGKPTPCHMKALKRVLKHCIKYKERGLLLKPSGNWNGKDKTYKFKIHGVSDSDYAKDPTTRKSVSGWSAFLNGAPYTRKSKMQAYVTLSVTEAECVAAVSCAMDMLYGKQFLEGMGLQVELPMILWMDNKGGVDLYNGWSVSGASRHYSTRLAFLRELKEQGVIEVKWLQGTENPADLFTKNLDKATYEKHAEVYLGELDDKQKEKKTTGVKTTRNSGGVLERHSIESRVDSLVNELRE
jgi:hypothetical protein